MGTKRNKKPVHGNRDRTGAAGYSDDCRFFGHVNFFSHVARNRTQIFGD